MKEWFHKQSRLTVPALCQSQSTGGVPSLNFNKRNLFFLFCFPNHAHEHLYNKITERMRLWCPNTAKYKEKGKNV